MFGLGGVGSYAVETLVRSGVGELTLIDDDTVALTNLNRQLEALHSTLGQSKAEAIAARCRDINPAVVLHPIVGRYEAAGRERFFDAKYDYILDWHRPCLLQARPDRDRAHTRHPHSLRARHGQQARPLAASDHGHLQDLRLPARARDAKGAQGARHPAHARALLPELPAATEQKETPPPGRRSVPASLTWVPGCGGLMMGGEAVLDLVRRAKEEVK